MGYFTPLNCGVYMANNDHHHHHHHREPVCSFCPAEHFKCAIHAKTTNTQTAIQNMGNSPPHTSAALIPSTLRLVLGGGLGWNKAGGERENQQDHKKNRKKLLKKKEKGRKKKVPYYVDHVYLTYLMMSQIYPSSTLQPQPQKRKKRHKRNKKIM